MLYFYFYLFILLLEYCTERPALNDNIINLFPKWKLTLNCALDHLVW